MRTWITTLALCGLFGCQALTEALPGAASMEGASQLPADPADQLKTKGELTFGERSWSPDECYWGSAEGRRGVILVNQGEGLAVAVWKEGVPAGESNVWFVDMANPPPDENFEVGSGRCGKLRVTDLDEGLGERVDGGARLACDAVGGELRFKNCVNAEHGTSAASMRWPGY